MHRNKANQALNHGCLISHCVWGDCNSPSKGSTLFTQELWICWQLRKWIFWTIHCLLGHSCRLPLCVAYIAIPHVTKSKTDSGKKPSYYATIFSGKDDRGLWSVSTAKHFVRSLHQKGRQVSLFASVSVRTHWDLVCILGRNVKSFLVTFAQATTLFWLHHCLWPTNSLVVTDYGGYHITRAYKLRAHIVDGFNSFQSDIWYICLDTHHHTVTLLVWYVYVPNCELV